MPKEPPTSIELVPELDELDPRSSLRAQAKQARAEARLAAWQPTKEYDHSSFVPDPNLLMMLGDRPYKGGGHAARRGKYAKLRVDELLQ